MSKISYSCSFCLKKFKLEEALLGQAFTCPKCDKCQAIPITIPKVSFTGGLPLGILIVFGLIAFALSTRYVPNESRLDRLKREAKIEEYYGNYSQAIYYYAAVRRELQREENTQNQIQEVERKIEDLQLRQKEKNKATEKSGRKINKTSKIPKNN